LNFRQSGQAKTVACDAFRFGKRNPRHGINAGGGIAKQADPALDTGIEKLMPRGCPASRPSQTGSREDSRTRNCSGKSPLQAASTWRRTIRNSLRSAGRDGGVTTQTAPPDAAAAAMAAVAASGK